MVNFTRLRLVKFIPISNTTLVIFIPNFTATHAITSTYFVDINKNYIIIYKTCLFALVSFSYMPLEDTLHCMAIGWEKNS